MSGSENPIFDEIENLRQTLPSQERRDILELVSRETQDGKGDEEVPESDFVSFATEGVEKEDN